MSFPRLSRTFFFMGGKAIVDAVVPGVDGAVYILEVAAPIRSKGACPEALLG